MKTPKQARRAAARLFRLCVFEGLLDAGRARKVVEQFVAAKPRGYLGVLLHFRKLVRLDSVRRTAKVQSAQPLPPDLQANVTADLARVYGPALDISFTDNPALIGGMRIQVGSDVYDGSVEARLAMLEQSF
jgi:F-type H+-transporting ATPase subunit delta